MTSKKPKVKESDLQRQIMEYLRYKGCVVVKFPSVGIYKPKTGSYIPQPRRGVSDILGCTPSGQFLAVEVKIKPNKPTQEQLAFLQQVEDNDGIGVVAYDLDIIRAII